MITPAPRPLPRGLPPDSLALTALLLYLCPTRTSHARFPGGLVCGRCAGTAGAVARRELLAEVLVEAVEVTAVVVTASGRDVVAQRLTAFSMFTSLTMRIERCIAGALSPSSRSVVSVCGNSVRSQRQLCSHCR